MLHYLFTNDLRRNQWPEILVDSAKLIRDEAVPDQHEDKSKNNYINTQQSYLCLHKGTKANELCCDGAVDAVILNFINRFQFPNARTEESFNNAVADHMAVAPLRCVVQLLFVLSMVDARQSHLDCPEFAKYIICNSEVATGKADLISLAKRIVSDRLSGVVPPPVPDTIALSSMGIEWKHCPRQIGEMFYLLQFVPFITLSGPRLKLVIPSVIDPSLAKMFFYIVNNHELWMPPNTSNWSDIQKSYIEYMDSGVAQYTTGGNVGSKSPPNMDLLSVALKMFAEKRAVDKPSGWDSYDAWTKGVREEFAKVDESLLTKPGFDYVVYLRKYSISWPVVNTKFAPHTSAEKHAVLKFLREQKESPKSVSWYIDDANRLEVGGNRVDGMSAKTLLYFMSELRPAEFAPWTEPTYEGLAFLDLHKGPAPKELTVETYEDCKAKQHQIVARMKELGIGKASDDATDPDYRTVNEFLWWLGQDDNKNLIKEEVMSKAMKKPTKKQITSGTATISNLLKNKEDSLMTMLIAGLLTKPLAILAGVSGTGKSRMVRRLAYKTCLDEDLKPSGESAPGNFKMVQVKPSWHDSADLLGYRSAVNEKHEYVSTDFVKFVLKAHAYPNTPFFVCLDEMNLAPVEHYFAEFLSACESIRKSDVTGEWTSDPIVAATDFDNNVLNLGGDILFESADAALDAALKKTKARIEKEGLFIPRNLFVVGTVNMDDSTGGFSRKVLDRAMTIVMNEVNLEDLKKDDKDLTLSDDNLFKTTEITKFINREDFDKGMLENGFIEQLEDIRLKLAKTPFALAYRFARETCMYKKALLAILDQDKVTKKTDGNPKQTAAGEDLDADRACGDIALDHMILMKLLPRLTGTTEKREKVIKEINDFLDTLIKEKLISKETLKDMVDRAKDNGGYLSFWP